MRVVGDRDTRDESAEPPVSRDEPQAARSGVRPEERPEANRPVTAASLWDVEQVSAYLSVPTSAVYKMTQRTTTIRIPHIRLGGRLRFRPRDIDHWLSLLTTSDLEALEQRRRKATKVTHGHDP